MSWGLGSLGLRIIAIRISPPCQGRALHPGRRLNATRRLPGEGETNFARGVMCQSVHTESAHPVRSAEPHAPRTAVASAGAAVGSAPPCTDTGRTPIGAPLSWGVREPQPHFQFSLRFRDVTRGAADVCTLTDVQFLTLASPGNPLRHVGVQN